MKMGKIALIALATLTLSATSGMCADINIYKSPKPPENAFDVAFGGAILSDYNFRGISQSNRNPSVYSYIEARYTPIKDLQFYGAISGESIAFPNRAAAEIDFYGGIRPTFGKLSLDIGAWYYYYPGGTTYNGLGPSPATCANGFFTPTGLCNVVKGNLSFAEVFAKAAYALNDSVTVGANAYHAPNWLNAGTFGTFASGTLKIALPSAWMPTNWTSAMSGEVGRYWFGVTDAFYGVPAFPNGVKYPDYTTWNIGLTTVYKSVGLDLRYHDTTLSRAECNIITSDHTATFSPGAITPANASGLVSRWCGAAFIAKLSFDTTLSNIK
jgi:uncharacterized protein (TIGR02001 family)